MHHLCLEPFGVFFLNFVGSRKRRDLHQLCLFLLLHGPGGVMRLEIFSSSACAVAEARHRSLRVERCSCGRGTLVAWKSGLRCRMDRAL